MLLCNRKQYFILLKHAPRTSKIQNHRVKILSEKPGKVRENTPAKYGQPWLYSTASLTVSEDCLFIAGDFGIVPSKRKWWRYDGMWYAMLPRKHLKVIRMSLLHMIEPRSIWIWGMLDNVCGHHFITLVTFEFSLWYFHWQITRVYICELFW